MGILFLKKFFLFNLVLTAGIFFYTCSGKKPVSQEKMIRIYTDMILAQDSLNIKASTPGRDALPDSAKQQIFSRHNVSSADYEKTINYYNENPEYWESFFTRTTIHLDSLKRASAR